MNIQEVSVTFCFLLEHVFLSILYIVYFQEKGQTVSLEQFVVKGFTEGPTGKMGFEPAQAQR